MEGWMDGCGWEDGQGWTDGQDESIAGCTVRQIDWWNEGQTEWQQERMQETNQ